MPKEPAQIIYDSSNINEDTVHDITDAFSSGVPIKYKMTPEELHWLDFIKGRYSIHEYLTTNMDASGVVVLDDCLSAYLDRDCGGAGKASCLSDESTLQYIFFHAYKEDQSFDPWWSARMSTYQHECPYCHEIVDPLTPQTVKSLHSTPIKPTLCPCGQTFLSKYFPNIGLWGNIQAFCQNGGCHEYEDGTCIYCGHTDTERTK